MEQALALLKRGNSITTIAFSVGYQDIYVFSKESGRVYYLEGVKYKDRTYYTLTQELIDKAHANGIKCNLFYTDNPDDARKYLKMGIDTILTNDFFPIEVATKDLR